MTFLIFSAKIDVNFFFLKAHASLDFSKSSDEKQISKLVGPKEVPDPGKEGTSYAVSFEFVH